MSMYSTVRWLTRITCGVGRRNGWREVAGFQGRRTLNTATVEGDYGRISSAMVPMKSTSKNLTEYQKRLRVLVDTRYALEELVLSNDVEGVKNFHKNVVMVQHPKNTRVIALVLDAFSALDEYGHAVALWKSIPEDLVDLHILSAWLSCNARQGHVESTKVIMRKMKDCGYPDWPRLLRDHQCTEVIQLFIRNGAYDLAVRGIVSILTYQRFQLCTVLTKTVLDALVAEEKPDQASYVWAYLLSRGLSGDCRNHELGFLCMADDVERLEIAANEIEKVYSKRELGGEIPILFRQLLNMYAERGDDQGMISTCERFEAMRMGRALRSEFLARAWMKFYATHRKWKSVISEMTRLADPQIADFNLLLKAGMKARDALPEVFHRGLQPDAETFGILAAQIYHSRGSERASFERLLRSMEQLNIDPRSRGFTRPLFEQTVKDFDPDTINELLSILEPYSTDKGLTYRKRVIQALVRAERIKDAIEFLRPISHDKDSLQTIFFGCLRKGDLVSASKCVQRMGTPPTIVEFAMEHVERSKFGQEDMRLPEDNSTVDVNADMPFSEDDVSTYLRAQRGG